MKFTSRFTLWHADSQVLVAEPVQTALCSCGNGGTIGTWVEVISRNCVRCYRSSGFVMKPDPSFWAGSYR